MNPLLELAALLAPLWRIVLCTVVGAFLALTLQWVIPTLSAGAVVAFVFAATSLGVIWNASVLSAREATSDREEVKLSKPVAFLGIALIGGLWGGLAEAALGVMAALAATIVVPWLLGPLFAALTKRPLRAGMVAFAMFGALFGLATPHAIALLFHLAEV